MADDILKNTLSTNPSATLTGNTDKDIKNLEAGSKNIESFSSVMRGIGTRAYDTRQKADLELAGKQFDPTKVSGGTFANIIGNLESRRGTDVSKTYGAGMEAEAKQREAKERLAAELREEKRLKEQQEREDRIRQEENDRELKNQAMLMGITDLSGSSEDLSIRIASAVKAKEKAQKSTADQIWGTDDKYDKEDKTPKQLWEDDAKDVIESQKAKSSVSYALGSFGDVVINQQKPQSFREMIGLNEPNYDPQLPKQTSNPLTSTSGNKSFKQIALGN